MSAKQFEDDNQALKREFDQEIYKQLNQYMKEFGEKNGYRFILGAEGSGVLMYANEGYNVSEQVIKHINERYQGGAK
jgi:outer membrane protein